MDNVVFLVALGVGGAFGYAVGRFQAARQKEQAPDVLAAPDGDPLPLCFFQD